MLNIKILDYKKFNLKKKKYFVFIMMTMLTIMLSNLLSAQNSSIKEKSIQVKPGGNLSITLIVGDIYLTTWNKDEINIKYEDDDDYKPGQLAINKDNNSVEINSSSDYFTDDINISLPAKFNLEVATTAGDIMLNGSLTGNIKIKTSGGDIAAENIIGNADLKTGGGDIHIGKVNGNAQINSSGGDLRIGAVTGTAEIKTSGGNIITENIGQSAIIKTAGGNISLKNIGGEAVISSGGGNIEAGEISGKVEIKTGGGNIDLLKSNGNALVKTGAGNINLQNVNGSVIASSGAGEIYVKLYPNENSNSEIKTSAGDITLLIPDNTKSTVDAKTSSAFGWGNDDENGISSDFKADESKKSNNQNHKIFVINGGGNKISLQAVYGTIKILKIKK